MHLLKQIQFLVRKEVVLEWRTKFALNGILLYVVSTIFICYLSFRQVSPVTWNALFWIIMLFAAVNAVAKSFILESRGRQLYYYSLVSGQAVILSKIIYNSLLMLVMATIALLFYSVVFQNKIEDWPIYICAVVLGSISFATVFTLVSAIASKAGNAGTLMAILSFPIVIPMLIVLIKLSKNAMDGIDRSFSYKEIGVLLAINIIVGIVSTILFPYLWRD